MFKLYGLLVNSQFSRFRWVYCQLAELRKCKNRLSLRKALRNLPKTLDDTYTRILEDIEKDLQQIVFRALTWICFSKEPLTPEQVAEAAVIDPQLCPPFHPEYRLCDPETDIRDILGSLVSAPTVESEFGKVCYLRLAHFSVKEYLLSGRILCSKRVSNFSLTELIGNALILECSLLYVFNAVDINEIVSVSETKPATTTSKSHAIPRRYLAAAAHQQEVSPVEKFPLHGYIGAWLVDHAQELRFQFQRKLESLLIKLFLDDSAFRFWSQLFCWPRIKTKIRRYIFLEPDFDHARLFLASYCGFSEVVKALVIKTAIVGARGPCSDTALHWASSSGQEVVAELLIDSGADVNAKMDYGYSALHFAVSSGKEATVRMLLKHKANVNVKANDGVTPLHIACSEGNEALVQILLCHDADANAVQKYLYTPLHLACFSRNAAVVQMLLDSGADISARNMVGQTVLHCACKNAQFAVTRILLSHKVDIAAKDRYGLTALHEACKRGHLAITRVLLNHKADVTAKDRYGLTALHHVTHSIPHHTRGERTAITRLLLNHGADISAKDSKGMTALDLASRYKHLWIAKALKKAAARNSGDSNEKLP